MDTTQLLYLAGAFVLGLLVAWFAGRSGPKRALEECEANAQTLQRSLDERTRSLSKLEKEAKERAVEIDRLGSEGRGLSAALKAGEEAAAQAAAQAAEQAAQAAEQIAQLQAERNEAQSQQLMLQTELSQARAAYAGERTRLADLFTQMEAQQAAAEAEAEQTRAAAQPAQASTALALPDRSLEVAQLTTQVQSLQTELEAVRANAARLAGQIALRPQLGAAQQEEYAALAGDPQQVAAALHERDQAVADARAETDYLRRTVGMLTGMGAELAGELERRRREQQALLYQVAGLNAAMRTGEMRQLADRQTAPASADTGADATTQPPAGTIEAETHELPVSTRPDNALEADDGGAEITVATMQAPAGTIEAETHELPVSTRPDNALEADDGGVEIPGARMQPPAGTIEAETHELPVSTRPDNALEPESDERGGDAANAAANATATAAALALDLRGQLDERTQELEELRTQSAPLQVNLDELQAEIEALDAANADLEAQLEDRDSELTELHEKLQELQVEVERAAAAKTSLAERLHLRGAAWSSLLARVAVLNADLDAALAADPAHADTLPERGDASAEQPAAAAAADADAADTAAADAAAESSESAPAAELAALAAAAPTAHGVPEGVRAADAAVSLGAAASAGGDIPPGEGSEERQGQALLDKLAAGVAAAVALFGRKNNRLADLEQQVQSLAGDKDELEAALAANADIEADLEARDGELVALQNRLGELEEQLTGLTGARVALESTLAAKDQALVTAQSQVEQLQSGLSQRAVRFDALSMHAGSLEAEMEIARLRRGELDEQLDAYLAQYGEAGEDHPAGPAQSTEQPTGENEDAPAGEQRSEVVTLSPAHPLTALGLLLKRRKDALDSANARIAELEAEISALTSAKSELDVQTGQQEQALAGLTAQWEAAQADAAARTADIEALQQQVNDLAAHKSELEAQSGEQGQALAELQTQLEASQTALAAAQAAAAAHSTEMETLGNQMSALQAQADAAEQERVRLETQWRSLNDDLAQFGSALDADDDAAASSLADNLAQRMGDRFGVDAPASRSLAAPLVRTAGVVVLTAAAVKKLAALRATRDELAALQGEYAAALAAKAGLESQLQSAGAEIEQTKTQLAAVEEQLAEARAELAQAQAGHAAELQALSDQLSKAQADHLAELQVLDAKTAELQQEYNAAESTRLRLEGALADLTGELQQLNAVVDSDDSDGLQQFVHKFGSAVSLTPEQTAAQGAQVGAEVGAEVGAAEGAEGTGRSAIQPLPVAAVAAALQRKQEALREAAARAAAMQAQMDELSADHEAAKTLLAERDQALLSVENKLTALTVQVEKGVGDFKAAARAAAAARGVEVQTTNALHDFAELKHIGVTFEQRLYRAGVGTFWEAAHLTDEDFALILRLSEMQQMAIDLEETRQDALRMAEATNTVGVISAGDPPDDFESIPGIGKVFEQRLYSAGIRTYWDLANAGEEQLAAVCRARKPLVPDYAAWIRQARIYLEVRGK